VLKLIEDISAIPVGYLKAMSRAMVRSYIFIGVYVPNDLKLQEISGFGHILSSFIGKELSTTDYHDLRTVM
jgi:hypothetical protein